MTHPSPHRSLLRTCAALAGALLVSPVVVAPARADAAAAAAAPAAAALNVRVTGGADPAIIAAAIAAELGVPTAVAADGAACTAPCVAVEIGADARAAIAVVLASGTYQRAIALPAAPGAAAEVVALVVGNLARDEAGALLAALAAPATSPDPAPAPLAIDPTLGAAAPPPPPIAAPPVAPPAREAAPRTATHYGFGLVPGMAYDVDGRGWRGGVAIDLVVGGRRRMAAFNVSGAASVVVEDVRGTQIAGAITHAGAVQGTQIAGAVATAGDVKGTQIAGAVAATRGDVRGAQIAGAVAVAGGAVDTQIGGAVSVARRVRGVQLAGAVNVADRVDGVQVGVVNVAGSGDGVSIGLINVVKGGRTELEATVDQQAIGNLVFRHGSRRWHNVYGVGGHLDQPGVDRQVTDDDVWMYGLGMGPSWQRGGATIDLEAMAWHVIYGGDFDPPELNLLNQLRLVVGFRVGPVGLVGGAALNAYVTTDPARDRLDAKPTMAEPDRTGTRVQVWPTAFVGVRL
ncbi:MAG: hypothetical protein JNK64_09530 [Myxococcales bacterium]|nr:hypothetical protein [Myxococcales bacterium]